MTDKMLAWIAIVWIVSTVYFTFQAIKGDYPIYYGIATSTTVSIISTAVGYLLLVVIK